MLRLGKNDYVPWKGLGWIFVICQWLDQNCAQFVRNQKHTRHLKGVKNKLVNRVFGPHWIETIEGPLCLGLDETELIKLGLCQTLQTLSGCTNVLWMYASWVCLWHPIWIIQFFGPGSVYSWQQIVFAYWGCSKEPRNLFILLIHCDRSEPDNVGVSPQYFTPRAAKELTIYLSREGAPLVMIDLPGSFFLRRAQCACVSL